MPYYKDDPTLRGIALAPTAPLDAQPDGPQQIVAVNLYDRLGGLMDAAAAKLQLPTAVMVASWLVESSGAAFAANQAIIRFEVHLFHRNWGQSNPDVFDAHFQFGGHNGIPGKPWQNHRFRASIAEPFRPFHGDQGREYTVLGFARDLGATPALLSISIGGPQILVSNYHRLGYDAPKDMYDAFQIDERFHVLGFMDFCGASLLDKLRSQDWVGFAAGYNGEANADAYGQKLHDTYDEIDPVFPQATV